jgi:MFS superfamily sulfate permease-like transporter
MSDLKNKLPHKQDWLASVVALVIAIPLSLGIAVASGAPPAAGLISCIIGALVVGMLSGSRLLITAPEASLAALVLQFIHQFGLAGMGAITFLSGVIQMTLGVARLGRFAKYIPMPVLNGLLTAIAVLLIAKQSHVLLGSEIPGSVWLAFTTFGTSFSNAVSFAGRLARASFVQWTGRPWRHASLAETFAENILDSSGSAGGDRRNNRQPSLGNATR